MLIFWHYFSSLPSSPHWSSLGHFPTAVWDPEGPSPHSTLKSALAPRPPSGPRVCQHPWWCCSQSDTRAEPGHLPGQRWQDSKLWQRGRVNTNQSHTSYTRTTPHWGECSNRASFNNRIVESFLRPKTHMWHWFLCFQTLVPAGYLIPISQHSLVSDKEIQGQGRESNKATTPTYNIYQTPTAGKYCMSLNVIKVNWSQGTPSS